MKNIFVLFLSLSLHVQAADIFTHCVTEVGATTSFFTETVGDQIQVTVLHHNGAQYGPFWNTLVVPNDLSTLQKKAESIISFGDQLTFAWKKSDCNWQEDKIFSCMGKGEVLAGDLKLEPWAFYSNLVTSKSFAGEFKSVELVLSYYKRTQASATEHFETLMKYDLNECLIEKTPILKSTKK